MEPKTALIGGDYDDYYNEHVQPVLDNYAGQIGDIQSSGAHAAVRDTLALGATSPGATDGFGGNVDYLISNNSHDAPTSASFIPQRNDGGVYPRTDSAALMNLPNTGSSFMPGAGLVRAPQGPTPTAASVGQLSQNIQPSGSNVATGISVEDIARSAPFNMTDQDLSGIRRGVEDRMLVQSALKEGAPLLVEKLLPPLGIADDVAKVISGMMDVYNNFHALDEPQRAEQSYQDELMRTMNNQMMQSATSQSASPRMRAFLGN